MRFFPFIVCIMVAPLAQALQNFNTLPNQWQVELAHQGFFSDANYDGNGQKVGLQPSHSYKHFLLQADTSYNLTSALSILGSLGMAHAQSTDGNFQRTTTAGTDVGLGVQYLFRNRFLWIAPELSGSMPLTTVDQTTDQALVNEGVMQATGRLNFLKLWGRRFQSFGAIGLTYQFDGRPTLIPWKVGSRVRIGGPWLGLVAEGHTTAIADSESANYRRVVTDRVDGGSLRYYSTAPSVAEVLAFFEYPIKKTFVLKVAGGTTLTGQNTAQGQIYQVMLNYSFGGAQENPSSDYFHMSTQYQKEKQRNRTQLKRFRVKTDEQDPELFREDQD